MPGEPLPTTLVPLNLLEIGYLNAFVWERCTGERWSPVARNLFTKLKEAAIELGIDWRYGELPPLPEGKP